MQSKLQARYNSGRSDGAAPCRRPPRRFHSLLRLVLALGLIVNAGKAFAAHNTLFLPLKINTPGSLEELTAQADRSLQNALAANRARKESFRMLNRDEAETLFDYAGTWPPSQENLRKITAPGATYIAAGSLTYLGKQLSIDLKVFDLLDPSSPVYFYQAAEDPGELDKAMDTIAGEILAYTGSEFLVAAVAPAGNERIDSGAILRRIQTDSGDVYDPEQLRADLKSVFKMGYFEDVRVKVEDTEAGKKITFEVTEKPLIGQVVITGNKELKEEEIRDVITVVPNTIVNPRKVREAADNVRALYKSKGFYTTRVETELTHPVEDRVDIRVRIEEGPKIYIKEVRFQGNEAFSDRELGKVVQTSEKNILSWLFEFGVLKREVLEQDVDRLTAFYQNHGYIEAKVGEPEVVQEEEWLYVTFNIAEGERYRVGSVNLTGDLIEDRQLLLERLKIDDEEFLSRRILREDILRLTDYYAENGYAFAEAGPKVETDKSENRVDITIEISKGELVHINRITVRGNTRTRDKVIRREMAVEEGGIFNSKAIRKSHERLLRLDFFEDVTITPEPTTDRQHMDIHVDVKEKPTGAFSIGAGYSSVDNLLVMGEISQNNLFGKGQRLALQANLSGTSTRYNISFTEPHLADTRLLFGFDLYNWQREYDDYTKDSYGGAIRFGYPIWEEWKMGFSYGYDHTDLEDVDLANASRIILDSLDIETTSFVSLSLSRDTRDRLYTPSKGSKHVISTKYAGGFLGGDSAFTKIDGYTSWYFPAFLKTTYHVKLSAGQVFENDAGKLPVYEKFYLGGINTIRGFNTGDISPIEDGDRVGGEAMWYTNLEWLFPLAREAGLQGLAFFDAGNVYEDEWNFDDIKKSVGLGFRWLSPMGLLRLEWGYNLDPVEDEEQSVWDFSIGGGF